LRQPKGGFQVTSLSIEQAVAIAKILAPASRPSEQTETFTPHIGKICIVRTYASGVFMAEVVAQSGRMVELRNSRRLWSWKAADGISLSAVAVDGVNSKSCRFPQVVPEHTVLDALELIPASAACIRTINETPIAKAT
jgi:hypothetical protein